MNLDMSSVLKAGLIAAIAGAVIGVLAGLPLIGVLFWVCNCFGVFLVPLGAGLLYGYFAPGHENLGQGALGGALAGTATGLIFGLFNIVTQSVISLLEGSSLAGVAVGGTLGLVLVGCGSVIFGGLLGAVGGAIWVIFQGEKA
jgi:hypothetical protein